VAVIKGEKVKRLKGAQVYLLGCSLLASWPFDLVSYFLKYAFSIGSSGLLR
jgi:hypothetical protein